MAELSVSSKSPSSVKADALVVGTYIAADGVAVLGDLPQDVTTRLVELAPSLGVTGAADEVRKVPAGPGLKANLLVLTGLGQRPDRGFTPEALRRAAGAATRELAGTDTVAIALPADSDVEVGAVAEGAFLGAYAFSRYRHGSDAKAPAARVEILAKGGRSAAVKAALERATVIGEAVHGVRDLVNTGPNDLFPAAFADLVKAAAKGTGAKVTVLDEKALAAGGYGGILAVGQGSTRPPRLVKITYTPSRPAARVALVGKGVTFDSGGLSIKPAAGMETMKSDMAGAAAVAYTVLAAARLGVPVAVTGYLCLAENMPSGSAQRPSDVITMHGGKTVEVLNTDAEGRLVMADGLVAAVEDKNDVVLDIATLTGAQVVALGPRVSAVMGDEAVRSAVVAAADACGEMFWPMPLPADLRASLDSKVADLSNIGDRAGGMLVAGLFLREFVGKTPWAHLDVAGPAFNEGSAHGYTPAGGTGVGVRTMLAFIESRGAAKR